MTIPPSAGLDCLLESCPSCYSLFLKSVLDSRNEIVWVFMQEHLLLGLEIAAISLVALHSWTLFHLREWTHRENSYSSYLTKSLAKILSALFSSSTCSTGAYNMCNGIISDAFILEGCSTEVCIVPSDLHQVWAESLCSMCSYFLVPFLSTDNILL